MENAESQRTIAQNLENGQLLSVLQVLPCSHPSSFIIDTQKSGTNYWKQ